MFLERPDASVVCKIPSVKIYCIFFYLKLLFRLEDFPNEQILWKEIENFTPILCMDTHCLSEEQTFYREMFSALPLCKLNNIFKIWLMLVYIILLFLYIV